MEERVFQLMEKMYGEIISIKTDVSGLKEDVSGLKEDVQELKRGQKRLEDGQRRLEERQDKLEEGQRKLAITQEQMKRDIQVIAEVVQTNASQNQRQHKEMQLEANERFVVIEGVLKTKDQ